VAARALAAAAAARRDVAFPLWPALAPLVDGLTARARAAAPDAVIAGDAADLRAVLERTLRDLTDSESPRLTPTGRIPER
jgi:hypothetical protein